MPDADKIHPLRRWLLVPALMLYSGVLLFGATPTELSPKAVHAAQKTMRNELRGIRFRPFAFVFEGRRGEWKRRSVVLAMHGRAADGELRLLAAAPTHRMKGYRWTQPAEEAIILKKFQYAGGNRLMRSFKKHERRALVHRLQRAGYMQQLGRFGCYSAHAGANDVDRVYLSVSYDVINYETGEIRDFAHVVHIYDCRRRRPLLSSRWTAAVVDDDGVPRPTPGLADPLMEVPLGTRSRPGAKLNWKKSTLRGSSAQPLRPKAPGATIDDRASSARREKSGAKPLVHGPTRAKARRLEAAEE